MKSGGRGRLILIVLLGMVMAPAISRGDDAASCSTVRLDGAGGAMEHVQPFDQGQVGNCYAHAAAEMYDAYRFSHGDTHYYHRTSPFAEFIRDQQILGGDGYGGGFTQTAMNFLKINGSCNNNDLFSSMDGQAMNDYCVAINAEWKQYQRLLADFRRGNEDTPYNRGAFSINFWRDRWAAQAVCVMRQHSIPREVVDAAVRILPQALEDSSLLGFYSRLFGAQCALPDKTIHANVPALDSERHETKFASRIDTELGRGLPVSASFCSKIFLSAPNAYNGVLERKYTRPDRLDPKCGSHAAPIIGRQLRNGKCMLLIRNSWGTSCNSYARGRRADCEAGKGNIWIARDELFRNTTSLEYFK